MSAENNNKYVFNYTDPSGANIQYTTSGEVGCADILRHFSYFLLGVSFANETILHAMQEILAERLEYPAEDERSGE